MSIELNIKNQKQEFIESKTGKIPEDWGGGIPWVSAKAVTNACGTFILDTEKT